jgi:hypothetical protein
VTDRGQADADINSFLSPQTSASPIHLAPPTSPLPHAVSEISPAGSSETAHKIPANGSIEPEPTIVPNSNTLSARPSRGGIAYPFKLQIEEADGRNINASTVTLNSITPSTVQDAGSQLENAAATPVTEKDANPRGGNISMDTREANVDSTEQRLERPTVERFETAQEYL